MSPRTTAILGAAAVVVLALGLVFGTGNREQQADVPPGQLAFPGLAAKLQDAATVRIAHHGASVQLIRKGEAWTVADAAGYSAMQQKVRTLTTALTELKLQEPRTANPDDYARLGVADAGKDTDSTEVKVLDAGGGAIAQLLIGHERTGSGGNGDTVYVRKPGEAQAWLADGHLSVDSEAAQWLDRTIFDIPDTKIARDVVTRGGQSLTFTRQGDKLTLTAPTDHPEVDPFKVADVGRALDGLSLEQVRPGPAPGSEIGRAALTTSDGVTITATVSKSGAELWATFAVSGDGAAKAPADALRQRVSGWAYQIGAYKEAALVPSLDDLKVYHPPAPTPAAPAPTTVVPMSKPPGAK